MHGLTEQDAVAYDLNLACTLLEVAGALFADADPTAKFDMSSVRRFI